MLPASSAPSVFQITWVALRRGFALGTLAADAAREPMSAALAPPFTARHSEAAIIFDNLHSVHDVVSDVLANARVPRGRNRAEIIIAARRYRDDTSFVMTEQEWRGITQEMRVENMVGPVQPTAPAGHTMPCCARDSAGAHRIMPDRSLTVRRGRRPVTMIRPALRPH